MTLRVALVGYGDAGRGIHAPLLRAAGHRVVAAVTRARADAVLEDWPGAVVHPSIEDLVAGPPVDLAVVASPTGAHEANVLALLGAGLPVVVDKPIALDAAGAQRLVAAGGRLTVFQNRRWDAEQLTLRALLAAGELGRVHRFERRWERWRPVPKNRWRENAVGEGGGLLLDLGSHLVDSAVQLFGPVASVAAEIRALTTPAEDDVFLALTHVSGTVSHLQAGSLVAAPGPRTRVLGDRAAYLVTEFEEDPTPFAPLAPPAGHLGLLVRGAGTMPVPRAPGGHVDFYRQVGEWLAGRAPVPVEPADALATARVLDAARVAAAERRIVDLIEPVDNGGSTPPA